MFKKNVGTADRAIRIALGIVLFLWGLMSPEMGMRWLVVVIGAVVLATGVLSTCPLYSLLRINTCGIKRS